MSDLEPLPPEQSTTGSQCFGGQFAKLVHELFKTHVAYTDIPVGNGEYMDDNPALSILEQLGVEYDDSDQIAVVSVNRRLTYTSRFACAACNGNVIMQVKDDKATIDKPIACNWVKLWPFDA